MTKAKDRNKTLKLNKKSIEEAVGKVAHTTKSIETRQRNRRLENVRIREEAAARCTKVIKRRVLKKQARKARADHSVIRSTTPGRTKI